MIKNSYKDLLLIIYQELNIHHREQTKQNNQIITFYIALISFFIGVNTYIVDNYNNFLINCVYLIIILIGFMIIIMLIQLRVWQLRYAGGIQFISSIMFSDFIIKNYDDFYKCVEHFETRSGTKHSLFAPLTCKMIWGCIFISLAPIGLYYNYLTNVLCNKEKMVASVFIICIIVYLSIIYCFFKNKIDATGKKGEIVWLLDMVNFKLENLERTRDNKQKK